jgi:hypothetical protein
MPISEAALGEPLPYSPYIFIYSREERKIKRVTVVIRDYSVVSGNYIFTNKKTCMLVSKHIKMPASLHTCCFAFLHANMFVCRMLLFCLQAYKKLNIHNFLHSKILKCLYF